MKKVLLAVCALAAISLLAPTVGHAQWQNRFGIYTSATAAAAYIEEAPNPFTNFTIYFVMTAPRDGDGAPMDQVKGWEYNVTVTGAVASFLRLSDNLPGGLVNVGDTSNALNSTYLCGLGTPLAVDNDMLMLHSWTCMLLSAPASAINFYLNPTVPASIPNKLAFLGPNDELYAAMPSSDGFASPVFAVGGTTTPIETESFGAIKALFR